MEVRILHMVAGSPHIVELLVADRAPFYHMLVFPAYDCTLHEFIKHGEHRLSEQIMSKICGQLVRAVCILAQHRVLHRDIKPRNVLVRESEPLAVVLSDFGSAVVLTEELACGAVRDDVCTRGYEAPEMLWQRPYGPPSDVWSLGVVMAEATTGCHPFGHGHTRQDLMRRIRDVCIEPGATGVEMETIITNGDTKFRDRATPTCFRTVRSGRHLMPILTSMLKVNVSGRASGAWILETHAALVK